MHFPGNLFRSVADIPHADVPIICGKLHVLIKNADISKEQTDAIVNITGAGFSRGGGKYKVIILVLLYYYYRF